MEMFKKIFIKIHLSLLILKYPNKVIVQIIFIYLLKQIIIKDLKIKIQNNHKFFITLLKSINLIQVFITIPKKYKITYKIQTNKITFHSIIKMIIILRL